MNSDATPAQPTPRKGPAMTDIEKYGCEHCFAAVYHPTDEEKRTGVCEDCRRRAHERALEEWRAFEDKHADVLTDR